jgi:tetratricopeptide (TPR) repeat protein
VKRLLFGLVFLALLIVTSLHQAESLRHRPLELKLGAVVSTTLVKLLAAEHAATLALRNVVRVMFYFGSYFDDNPNLVKSAPEYANMYQHLVQAVQLDPYNMDAYYFAQAAFTWEVGRAREVNRMLDHGMKYRPKDFLLPFYAGFNAAYFLKDYPQAARYFQMASERSGNTLFAKLASRYFYEGGEGQLGLAYLDTMIKGAADRKTRLIYEKRRDALLAIQRIEEAVTRYRESYDSKPKQLTRLLERGTLKQLPVDPYGGTFYLDEEGRVRTTSKFALKRSDQAPVSLDTPQTSMD